MENRTSSTSKKSWLWTSIFASIMLTLSLWQVNTPTGNAQSVGGFEGAIYDIVPDSTNPTSLPGPGNPFLLTGEIYPFRTVNEATCDPVPATTPSLGTWRAWGLVADGGRLVMQQSLQIAALNGSIELQGPSGITLAKDGRTPAISGTTSEPFTGPSEVLAATGGAGTFRGANGEAQVRPYCQSEADTLRPFRYDRPFCISLEEAPRRKGGNR
jgi:hypothetical protein